MEEGAEAERAGLGVEAPAGERAGGFLDVRFGVAALAQREELHHLAREVLVGRAPAVLHAVEIEHHRRILADGVQHDAEVAERVGAQHRVLRVHEARERHLGLRRDEMVVPEQRHPLGERRRRHEHLVHPPAAELQALARALLHERLALGLGRRLRARSAQRATVEDEGGRHGDGGKARLAQELVDGLGARERRIGAHFRISRTEAGPGEQVARIVVAQRRGRGGQCSR